MAKKKPPKKQTTKTKTLHEPQLLNLAFKLFANKFFFQCVPIMGVIKKKNYET